MIGLYQQKDGGLKQISTLTLFPGNAVRVLIEKVPARSKLRFASSDPKRVTAALPASASHIAKTTLDSTTLGEYPLLISASASAARTTDTAVTITVSASQGAQPAETATLAVTIDTPLALPDADTDAGLLARLFIAEANPRRHDSTALTNAKTAVTLMRQVIANRQGFINKPPAEALQQAAKQFGGRPLVVAAEFGTPIGAVPAIVKASNQFAGFESYPKIEAGQQKVIDDVIATANDAGQGNAMTVKRSFVQAALAAAAATPVPDIWPKGLYWWRTAGASAPTQRAEEDQTLGGNTFYRYRPMKDWK